MQILRPKYGLRMTVGAFVVLTRILPTMGILSMLMKTVASLQMNTKCPRTASGLVLRRPLDVIDRDNVQRALRRFQLQSELFLNRGKN